jgi:hypothetical protein
MTTAFQNSEVSHATNRLSVDDDRKRSKILSTENPTVSVLSSLLQNDEENLKKIQNGKGYSEVDIKDNERLSEGVQVVEFSASSHFSQKEEFLGAEEAGKK